MTLVCPCMSGSNCQIQDRQILLLQVGFLVSLDWSRIDHDRTVSARVGMWVALMRKLRHLQRPMAHWPAAEPDGYY